jgi:hypothetical protein
VTCLGFYSKTSLRRYVHQNQRIPPTSSWYKKSCLKRHYQSIQRSVSQNRGNAYKLLIQRNLTRTSLLKHLATTVYCGKILFMFACSLLINKRLNLRVVGRPTKFSHTNIVSFLMGSVDPETSQVWILFKKERFLEATSWLCQCVWITKGSVYLPPTSNVCSVMVPCHPAAPRWGHNRKLIKLPIHFTVLFAVLFNQEKSSSNRLWVLHSKPAIPFLSSSQKKKVFKEFSKLNTVTFQ